MRKIKGRIVFWITLQGLLKMILSLFLVIIIVFIYTKELPSTATWTYWAIPLSGKTIALDAGHGGVDGGAVSKDGLIEKDINLGVALYLRDYLQQAGALVIMTREEDADLANEDTKSYKQRKTEDLKQRVNFINGHNVNMMISVHVNSIPSPKWNGAQTFYDVDHPDNSGLAHLIQQELIRNLQNTTRVAKSVSSIYLLKSLSIPSVLVEVGFLSNTQEAQLLAETPYQQKLAAAIYQGILRYYSGEKVGAY